jgi:hypothetical protein
MVPEKSELEGVTSSYHALVAVIQRVRVGSGDRISSMRTAPHDARHEPRLRVFGIRQRQLMFESGRDIQCFGKRLASALCVS